LKGVLKIVQSLDGDVFMLQPPTEVGDTNDLPTDRMLSVALFGHSGGVRIQVFTQWPLAKPFNRA
jgi:hypothetical protein